MQFLTLSRRRTEAFSDGDFSPHLVAETERVKALYAKGFIRQIWHRGDMSGACLLVEAGNLDEVRAQLNTLPLVAANMLEVVAIVPLDPYRGFAPRQT